MALRSIVFTTSGSWTAPLNVSKVTVEGFGGGGGGGGGSSPSVAFGNTTSMGGGGGGGSLYLSKTITVVPGTTYTITVGAGGNGGAGGASPTTPGAVGSDGDDSSFGSLFIMPGASGGGRGNLIAEGSLTSNAYHHTAGGPSVKLGNMLTDLLTANYISINYPFLPGIGYGGYGSVYHVSSPSYSVALSGMPNRYATTFSSPGSYGSVDGTYDPGGGGGGGGNGPEGVGGNGGSGGNGINGAAISATNGGNGVAAAANTGAGGGGGGGAGQSNGGAQTGGNGGNGGSGLVIITFDL